MLKIEEYLVETADHCIRLANEGRTWSIVWKPSVTN